MALTLKQKYWILKTALRLYCLYRTPLRKRMLWIYKQVEKWAKTWKAEGYQVVPEEKTRRWVRLGKAFGLSQSDVELNRMAEDTWTLRNLRKAEARRSGKTAGRKAK